MEAIGTLIAGLGLFFVGVKIIGYHFRQLTSNRIRSVLRKTTNKPLGATILGLFSGAVTQSSSAVTFIVMSMVTARMLSIRKAMPVAVWANVGTSALVLLATFDLHLFILYLLGFVGFCYYLGLDESVRYRHALGSLLGVGLLFFGLSFLKASAIPIRDHEFVIAFISQASSYLPVLMLLGVIFGFVAHSSATVSVVAVALASTGLLNLDQTLMIILGASLGSGISIMMISRHLAGDARRIALIQFWIKVNGVVLVLPLFISVHFYQGYSFDQLAIQLGVTSALFVAIAYLILQIMSALSYSLFSEQIFALLDRLKPERQSDTLARPLYLYSHALEDSGSALDLLEREQIRLISRLPTYLDPIRTDVGPEQSVKTNNLHPASRAVLNECTSFLSDLVGQSQSSQNLKRLLAAQAKNDLIRHLQEGCQELQSLLSQGFDEKQATLLANQIVEGLHVVLSIFVETVEEQSDPDMILLMSQDRSGLMDRTRQGLLSEQHHFSDETQARLFALTTLFERLIWLISRYSKLYEQGYRTMQDEVAGQASPKSAQASNEPHAVRDSISGQEELGS